MLTCFLPCCSSLGNAGRNNPGETEIEILFAGDVMLDWGIHDTVETKGIPYPVKLIRNFLSSFDYRFCNLECPVADAGIGKPHPEKKYVFLGKPKHIGLLKSSGINCVSLANNHAGDFGTEGMLETIKNLEKNNISITGAGANIAGARLPATTQIKGINIAILAYTDWAYPDTIAGTDSPGVANANLDFIKEDINQYRQYNDFIIVSIHWGNEYSEYPVEKDINLAHQIIDSGADAIIGHHPHVAQGVEIYNGKPVFYSLGNFIFGSVNEDAGYNILAEICFAKSGMRYIRIYPVNGNGKLEHAFQCKLKEGDEATKALSHLLMISKYLKSDFSENAVVKDSSLVYNF